MESIGPKAALGFWEVRHRVEGHEDGENTPRPGFLETDRPPHAIVTVPTNEEAGLQQGASHLGVT